LLVLLAIIVLFMIGILILGFIVHSMVHRFPTVVVAVPAWFFLGRDLLWGAVAFVVVAILMLALRP
jgi:hypothetical protein